MPAARRIWYALKFCRSGAEGLLDVVTKLVELHLRFHTYRLGWTDRAVRRYVRDLQETLIRTLAGYGIAAEPRDGPEHIGVWTGKGKTEEKIASIGVHLSRWVTTHGFALNVATDLSYFAGIIPCGLKAVRMTSIERLLGTAPPLAEVAAAYARHFGAVFDRELVGAALETVPVGGG